MNTSHAKSQPQDPVAAKLGMYMVRAGVVVAVLIAALPYLRG
jgi:hypothetical protein